MNLIMNCDQKYLSICWRCSETWT